MIPNDFGLIRQKEHNLFALLFPELTDISEYQIELLYVDSNSWFNNEAVTATGSATSWAGMKYAIIDASKYDYVLLPISVTPSGPLGVYGGSVVNTSALEATSNRIYLRPIDNFCMSCYVLLSCERAKGLVTNQRLEDNLPIIGFIRHRSDQVNPKGIIKDVNSDLLQPVKKDELDGEAERERDELPGNTESPDLDFESSVGADERTDS